MRTTEFYISTQIIQDKFIVCGAGADLPLSRIVAQVLNQNKDDHTTRSLPSDFKVLVARQIIDPDHTTLKELDFEKGDYLLIYRPSLASVKLKLSPPKRFQDIHAGWVIDRPEVLIGRKDEETPDIDLTPLLEDARKVSRQLAWLREEKGRWTITLHEEAHSSVFVDQTKLELRSSVELNDTSVISFGKNWQDPDLRLLVRLQAGDDQLQVSGGKSEANL